MILTLASHIRADMIAKKSGSLHLLLRSSKASVAKNPVKRMDYRGDSLAFDEYRCPFSELMENHKFSVFLANAMTLATRRAGESDELQWASPSYRRRVARPMSRKGHSFAC